jgi:serine phosphatase RsbU (regulator of sigma subunit)
MLRRTLLPSLALALLAITGTAAFILWTCPLLNAPLALARFDEPMARQKVAQVSRDLLQTQGRLDLALQQQLDGDTLRRMQRLYGIRAANRYASQRVPVHKWSYSVTPPGIKRIPIQDRKDALLTVEVGSDRTILGLKRKLDKDRDLPIPVNYEKARDQAMSFLRLVGVIEDRVVLTSTKTTEDEGSTVFEFTWKESPEGLPGLLFEYGVMIRSGYIVSYERKTLFREGEEATGWSDLLPALGSGVAWFFLALLTLVLFVQELRRDQVDMHHARRVALAAGILTLIFFLSNPSQGWVKALVDGAVWGLFSLLFFGFLWAVGESLLRQAAPERLRHADWILHGEWNVRDLGQKALWAWGAGLALLLLPSALLLVGSFRPEVGLSIMPPRLRLENLSFPGGLLIDALVSPLPVVALVGITFLGVFYPLLRRRFSKNISVALFGIIFILAATPLAGFIVSPWAVAASLAAIAGLVLFKFMEKAGLVPALLALYFPLALRNACLLAGARNTSAHLQGQLALGVLSGTLLGAALLSVFGRAQVRVREYEPDYLRRMRERERFARELEIAKGIQQRFLPRSMPQIPDFEVAATCVPAMEVGGDIYDLLPMPGGRWFLLIGDVSGKGVKAAFYMTLTKGILHAVTSTEGDDIAVIRTLNRLFKGLSEEGVFLTLCAVVLDPGAGEARLLSAGHNPPLLLRRGEVKILEPKGIVLGLVSEEIFMKSLRSVQFPLEPGDVILTYTDGVTEAMDPEEEQFGMDRLIEILRASGDRTPQAIVRAVVDEVKAFERGAPQADDLTLLVVKYHAT